MSKIVEQNINHSNVHGQDAEAVLDGISSKAEDVKESAHETASKVEQKSAQTADNLKAKAR